MTFRSLSATGRYDSGGEQLICSLGVRIEEINRVGFNVLRSDSDLRQQLLDAGGQILARHFKLPGTFLQPLISAARQLLCAGAADRHILDRNDILCLFVGSVEKDNRDFQLVGKLDLFSRPVGSKIHFGRDSGAAKLERHRDVVVVHFRIEGGDEDVCGRLAELHLVEGPQCREQTIDAHRCARRRNAFAEEAHYQIVVAPAAEDRPKLRRVQQDRFKDRPVVIRQASGNAEIDDDAIVVVSGDIQVVRHLFENRDLLVGAGYRAEGVVQSLDDFGPAGRLDSQKLFDLTHLRRCEAKARDLVAGFVRVAGGQFQANLRNAVLFQFVDDAKYVHGAFRCDGGVGQQQVQDAPAGKPNLVPGNAQRFKAVANTANDLRVCHLRLDANRVDVELHELAKTARPRLVRAPHGPDGVSAKRSWQIPVLRDDASEGHGVIEPQAKLLFFRVLNNEDGFLDFFPAGTGEHIKILDCRRGQRYESVEFVNTSNDIDHGLTGQRVFGQ